MRPLEIGTVEDARSEAMAPRRAGRLAVVLTAVLIGVGLAAPAAADPAGPTHYDSRLTGVELDEVDDLPLRFEVLGGDAFLVVEVDPGTELEIPGYEGEPYVRIAGDGTVEVNSRAPTRWLNDSRYGAADVEVPADAVVDAPPRWEIVGHDGVYAWHDHRIHWMSPSLPRQVDPTAGTPQPVDGWTVPIVVDGQPATVTGELRWLPGPPLAVTIGLIAVALLTGAALASIRPTWTIGMTAGVGVVALGTGLAKNLGLPTGAEGEPFLVVLPVLALALTGVGILLAGRGAGRGGRAQLIAATAGVPLLVWAVIQGGALARPIVPGPLPVGVVRAVVALAISAGAASLLAAARAVLAATALDRPEASTPTT